MSSVHAGILGLCVGDALGVPAEFRSREALSESPIVDMIGYGSHNQPPGTWSDDSSLTFCLMDSMNQRQGVDLHHLADSFAGWLLRREWTPHGQVFDVGMATAAAIERLHEDMIRPDLAGGQEEFSNGNGSLMRILPLAYYLRAMPLEERLATIARVSSVTHRHQVSIAACFIYVEIAILLQQGIALEESIARTKDAIAVLPFEDVHTAPFSRIFAAHFARLSETDIQSSGYVVHTLEASLWCLLTSGSYAEAVLKAVNLGEDTDTTGAVTGGLAGLIYGIGGIPVKWIDQLARKRDILALCDHLKR